METVHIDDAVSISRRAPASLVNQLTGSYPNPDTPQPPGPWDSVIRRGLERVWWTLVPKAEPWSMLSASLPGASALTRIASIAALISLTAVLGSNVFGQPLGTAPRTARQGGIDRLAAPFSTSTASLLEERQDFTWEGAAWQLEGTTRYMYEGIDRLEEVRYYWNGRSYIPLIRVGYTRGDLSLVTVTEYWDAASDTYIPSDLVEIHYAYDPSTRAYVITDETRRFWEQQVWTNTERTLYTIDEDFNVTGSQTEIWGAVEWVPYQRQTVHEEGGLIVLLLEGWDAASWINVERTTFPYATIRELNDALRTYEIEASDYEEFLYGFYFLPASETQSWNGFGWTNDYREVRHVDAVNGRTVKVVFEEWIDGRWAASSRLNYAYDEAGALTSLTSDASFVPDVWFTILREIYLRDEGGRMATITTMLNLGDGLTAAGKTEYIWRSTGTSVEDETVPPSFELSPAYPNPFNASTRLGYKLNETGPMTLGVFDALGRRVANLFDGVRAAGSYEATFDAVDLPSGLYLICLESPHGRAVRTVTLLK